jgi:hypothetical protein
LTPVVRRRAWTEPRVRLWWLLCLGVLAVTLAVGVRQAATWWSERQLLSGGGVEVTATIVRAITPENDMSVPGKSMSPDSVCEIEFEWPKGSGKLYRPALRALPENAEEGRPVITGSAITLHVDPDDPERWTARTKTPPLGGRQLIGVAVGAPIIVALAVVAVLKRRRMLDVWAGGLVVGARVLGVGTSPVAPQSRSLRCTVADPRDKRVFTVFVPGGSAARDGDEVWVVRLLDKVEPTVAAGWFERGNSGPATARAGQATTTTTSAS